MSTVTDLIKVAYSICFDLMKLHYLQLSKPVYTFLVLLVYVHPIISADPLEINQ
jgi:hypothetical protein